MLLLQIVTTATIYFTGGIVASISRVPQFVKVKVLCYFNFTAGEQMHVF